MTHELQKLTARHHTMVQDCMLGMTRKEIAEKYGMTPEGVGAIMKSPIFQDEVARERELVNGEKREMQGIGAKEVRERIANASLEAADKMVELMHSPQPELQFRSSQYILDRVLGKDSAQGAAGATVIISGEQMNVLILAMNESKGKDLDV